LQKTVQPEDEQGGLERQIGLKLLAETGRSGRETTKSESGFNGVEYNDWSRVLEEWR
jgi:hypothetical protein